MCKHVTQCNARFNATLVKNKKRLREIYFIFGKIPTLISSASEMGLCYNIYTIVSGTHECDSPSGFCEDKCPFNNGSYPFWRMRNTVDVPLLWTVSQIQMFSSSSSNKNLIGKPIKAYASSYFGPGIKNFFFKVTILHDF